MSFSFMIVIFLIGFAGSFISGMVGIGGAIINYPMILYIPVLLGFTGYTVHEVSGITAIQVFFAAFAGVWVYRKSGYINKTLVLYMGTSILVGSFVGSLGSRVLDAGQVNIVYAILATIAAIMMFIPKKNRSELPLEALTYNKGLASVLAFIVGTSSGIVGAGGAFLLVPIMLVILKIPTHMTIATSLAITFISSIGITIGKVTTGQVVVLPSIMIAIASLIASPLGASVGKRLNQKILQWILAILIVSTSIKIWMDIAL
ncbi:MULTISPECIES: sulfite exporter TauE/SafE family protein [Bacillus]|uniref:sulfite exporter TauE/SafE family protein n=1 Tax=Bacillus TaxID=1386 RepID=UPI0002D58BEF|nr:sulfite exporter TauE/SafE family protein [Bacillus pseudomycoides]MED1598957.1 sulfite exporter TauE/SafE family protein [Bacillus pseudomycoides]MED4709299.1 sulfite exporter TauE/SafE family protein [Bacillus pseudomycoides]OOR51389.1 anion permease [Bacillus pseudomycoides]PDY10110.1 sulfite exporter TauE/SafE family protein [Bacillus pseudomycoides]PEI44165.1 sulfite exporter TauE/SafE family protein [Bacillus pseudomycoides]